MTDKSQWIDFELLEKEMHDASPVGPTDLYILGGKFGAEELNKFIADWALPRDKMPWSIWQWTDEIKILHAASTPQDLKYLDRGRLFGEGGDLEVRRDAGEIFWRYIGEDVPPPLTNWKPNNFWDQHSDDWHLHPYYRSALLWGVYDPAHQQWSEPRVGNAELIYPNMNTHPFVQVEYIEYLYGDNVELVRLLGLQGYSQAEEENNG